MFKQPLEWLQFLQIPSLFAARDHSSPELPAPPHSPATSQTSSDGRSGVGATLRTPRLPALLFLAALVLLAREGAEGAGGVPQRGILSSSSKPVGWAHKSTCLHVQGLMSSEMSSWMAHAQNSPDAVSSLEARPQARTFVRGGSPCWNWALARHCAWTHGALVHMSVQTLPSEEVMQMIE